MEKEIEIFIEAAEQLKALKATLADQQGSSVRLMGLTNTLEQVAAQIAKIPSGLSAVLTKAEAVEQRVVAATFKVEALRDGIPAIVERIERSDIGRSVDALTSDIAENRSDLKTFRESISKVDDLVQQVRGANEAIFQEVRGDFSRAGEAQEKVNTSVYALRSELLAKLDGMEKRIVSTEQWSEKSIGATENAFEVVAIAVKGVGERQSTAFEAQEKVNASVYALRSELVQGFQIQLDAIVYALRSELLPKLDGMEKRIVSTEQWSEKSVRATVKAFEVVATAVKGVGERQSTALQGFQIQLDAMKVEEMAEIRKELKSISALILQQAIALDVLSKKKGLFAQAFFSLKRFMGLV